MRGVVLLSQSLRTNRLTYWSPRFNNLRWNLDLHGDMILSTRNAFLRPRDTREKNAQELFWPCIELTLIVHLEQQKKRAQHLFRKWVFFYQDRRHPYPNLSFSTNQPGQQNGLVAQGFKKKYNLSNGNNLAMKV